MTALLRSNYGTALAAAVQLVNQAESSHRESHAHLVQTKTLSDRSFDANTIDTSYPPRRRRTNAVALVAGVRANAVVGLLRRSSLARLKRFWKRHVWSQLGDDGNVELLAYSALHRHANVGHVAHDDVGHKLQRSGAIPHAGLDKQSLATIRGHSPRHERDQNDSIRYLAQPQPQCVLFVADEPAALAAFQSPSSQSRTLGRVAICFFYRYWSPQANRSHPDRK